MQFNFTEGAKRPLLKSSSQQLEEIRFDGLDVSKEVTSLKREKTANSMLSDVESRVAQLAHKLSQDKTLAQSGKHAAIAENVAQHLEKINGLKTDSPSQGSENVVKPDNLRERLTSLYGKVLVVNSVPVAKQVVWMLRNWYSHLVHACDTEV